MVPYFAYKQHLNFFLFNVIILSYLIRPSFTLDFNVDGFVPGQVPEGKKKIRSSVYK